MNKYVKVAIRDFDEQLELDKLTD